MNKIVFEELANDGMVWRTLQLANDGISF